MKTKIFIISIVFLYGCVVAQGPAFKPAPTPKNGQGLVYIYFINSMFLGSLVVSIEGKFLTDISPMGYMYLYIPTGTYLLEAHYSSEYHKRTYISITGGETKYIQLDASPLSSEFFKRQSYITAKKNLAKTKYQSSPTDPFNISKTATKTVVTPPKPTNVTVPTTVKRASKGKAAIIPTGTIGDIKESQKSIITNKFLDELSNDYDIVPQEEYEKAEEEAFQQLDYEECTEDQCIRLIQELLQVENIFKLQMIREGMDTQVSLTLTDLDRKLVKSYFCEDCNTSSLIKVVSKLYNALEAKR